MARTFGDVESKLKQFGGLDGTVVCTPEVIQFDNDNIDYIFMASDGIFDVLSGK